VPKTEAVLSRGYYFCQEECARRFVMHRNQEVSKVDNNGSSR
jgi:YHS domain-containing protein